MNREKILDLARTVYESDFSPAAEDRLLRFAALIEAQVCGDAEPVAYIGTDGSLGWLKKPDVIYSKAVPLFMHPAPAVVRQLVEAAKRAMNYAENVVMAESVSFDYDDDLPFIESALAAAKETWI